MKWIRAIAFLLLLCLLPACSTFYSKRIRYDVDPPYSVVDPQFLRSMGHLMGPGVLASNKVTGYYNGDQFFPAMLEAIHGAKKSVNLETYIYWSGDMAQQFSDALTERARAGVQVHVLIDWLGSGKIDSRLLNKMEEAGVDVEKYNPLVIYRLARVNHRDHRKLLIVDGRIGFTGGAGIASEWEGNAEAPNHWRDTQFKLEGPAVAQMQAVFLSNWMRSTGEVLAGNDFFPPLQPVGDEYAQVFGSSPRDGTETVRLMYLLSIAAARKSIRISTPYFVPGNKTEDQLVEACKRGVKVEILVPGAKTDVPIVRHASRSRWGRLLQAGVHFYEYQPTMYHCKAVIVDDIWVSVGSANVDNRSFQLNDEANLNVYSTAFAAQQVAIFEDDKKKSREVTFKEWQDRSIWKRIMETFTAPFRSQL